MARIPPHAVNLLETPSLARRQPTAPKADDMAHLVTDPRRLALRGVALDVRLDDAMLGGVRRPALLVPRVLELVEVDQAARFALDGPEEVVGVLAEFPVHGAVLGRPLDAARERLVDVDVLDARIVLVVLDGERDGSSRDRGALEP